MSSMTDIKVQIGEYKRKFYLNQLLRGTILCLAVLVAAFLFFNLAEFAGNFNSSVRAVFLFSFIALGLFTFGKWVAYPIYVLLNNNKQISDEEAAKQIGDFFPEVKDKLLNIIQLSKLSQQENLLLQAGISQKTAQISIIPFKKAVDYNENKRYAKYAVWPLLAVLIILIVAPHIFTESTARIVRFDRSYANLAPFRFTIINKALNASYNEDFDLQVALEGEAIPEQVFLVIKDRKIKLNKFEKNRFSYTFKKIQQPVHFNFEAVGFYSDEYELKVNRKPSLKSFEVALSYPSYLGKKNETLANTGNLSVPEGTQIRWNMETHSANELLVGFSGETKTQNIKSENNRFKFDAVARRSGTYAMKLRNTSTQAEEQVDFYTEVIPDKYPEIHVEEFRDTSMFSYVVLAGNMNDDYGLSSLQLFYRKEGKNRDGKLYSIKLKMNAAQATQNFYFTWNIDSLQLQPGEKLEYYLVVADNDGFNGPKKTKSKILNLKVPSAKEMDKELEAETAKSEKQLDNSLKKVKELQNEFKKLQDRLKGKKNFSWQDKKAIEELIKKQEDFNKEAEQINENVKQTLDKQQRFTEQDQRVSEKIEMLKQLMNDVLDDETKKLYEELQKLLNDKNKEAEIQEMLQKMEHKDQNTQKELDRALEMYKQLQFEKKLNQTVKDLDKLSQEQKKLAEQSEQKKPDTEALKNEQEKLNKEFNDVAEKMKQLQEMNKELENKHSMENTEKQEQSIKKEMQNASENLGKKQPNNAGKNQKSAAEQMEDMKSQMEKMAMDMLQQQTGENIEDLRQLLQNLLHLSFDQEELLKNFKKVNQQDPRYLQLGQTQLKLSNDSKIIEDSLYALAKRVPEIQSMVSREMGLIKDNMEQSVKAIQQRRPDMAAGKQQMAMTSINNLALMLNDVLKQLQEQMKSMMKGQGQCKKPGGKGKQPNLSQLQQELNQKIDGLKKSGKTGKEMSQELAKMAAEQEMIRKALKEMESKQKGSGNKSGDKEAGQPELGQLIKEMEKTENDLVNKRINQETIMRQKDIMSRLLEAEKSMRERELDKQRESQTAQPKEKPVPQSFEKYLKEKEKQVELLKTLSPAFTPYYKQEVNEYFQKIEN